MRHSRIGILLIVLSAVLFLCAYALAETANVYPGTVRVCLASMNYPDRLDITIRGRYMLREDPSIRFSDGESITVLLDKSNCRMLLYRSGVQAAVGSELTLCTEPGGGLLIHQAVKPAQVYPADLQLKAVRVGDTCRMYPVAHVFMEDYLAGVLPYEMGSSADMEALKAQAVAARTYAMSRMLKRAASLYDVVDTTNDQVYYGTPVSAQRCVEAVEATKGIVMMQGGELISAYYTASNGGQTESAFNLWQQTDCGYLTVKDDPYDRLNPFSATRSVTVYGDYVNGSQHSGIRKLLDGKLPAALKEKGYAAAGATILSVDDIVLHTTKYAAPDRQYTKADFYVMAATGNGYAEAVISLDLYAELEKELDMSLNPQSNELWTVSKQGNDFVLTVSRFGHGVGMSQRGAMQMGIQGYAYDEILHFYYGSDLMGCVLQRRNALTNNVTDEFPAAVPQRAYTYGYVTSIGSEDMVPVRYYPSAEGVVTMTLPVGTMVQVIAMQGEWAMIAMGELRGYMASASLLTEGNVSASGWHNPTLITRWAKVTSSGVLNLRDRPDMNGQIVTQLPGGSVLCVLDQQGQWAQVQYHARRGYVNTDFLSVSDVYPVQVEETESEACVYVSSGNGTVNLRQETSPAAAILRQLPVGTRVTVLGQDSSWSKVQAEGLSGYMMTRFLRQPGVQAGEDDVSQPGVQTEAIVRTVFSALNLRSAPSDTAAVLTGIPRGTSIVVLQRDSQWCQVRFGTYTGYVASAYLQFPADAMQNTPVWRAVVAVSQGRLNMRAAPRIGSDVLHTLSAGTMVDVYGAYGEWTRIGYAGACGYVMSKYLRRQDVQDIPVIAYATVNTESGSLNLRRNADRNAEVLCWVPKGTTLGIVQREGGWCRTSFAGRDGYVMERYLSYAGEIEIPAAAEPVKLPMTTPVPSQNGMTAGVTGGSLNLREEPSTSAKVLSVLPDGTELMVIEPGLTWSRVTWGNLSGYVMSAYLNWNNGNLQAINASGGGLNLRETASTDARVLCMIPAEGTVAVHSVGENWCRVTWQDRDGYVMSRFLTLVQVGTQAMQQDEAAQSVLYVKEGPLNMRAGASTASSVLIQIPQGSQVEPLDTCGEWYQVRYQGMDGYVPGNCLSVETMVQTIQTTTPAVHTVSSPVFGTKAVAWPAEGTLSLYQYSSVTAPVLTDIQQGAEVTVVLNGEIWSYIIYKELTGYCMTQYLRLP